MLIADIPGIIEGAHEGIGLGDHFLRHVERCAVLLHLIDGTEEDVAGRYKAIRKELKLYSPVLAQKQEIIVLNKIDALTAEEITEKPKRCKKPAAKTDADVRRGAYGNDGSSAPADALCFGIKKAA